MVRIPSQFIIRTVAIIENDTYCINQKKPAGGKPFHFMIDNDAEGLKRIPEGWLLHRSRQ